MTDAANLSSDIKRMIVENLMLQVSPESIADDSHVRPWRSGLDSVDALQLVVALDKKYGLKIPDPETARRILQSVTSITSALRSKGS